MTDTPRPGDKIRVSFETKVNSDGTYYGQLMANGNRFVHDSYARVEILERADNPSNDPIGTLRSSETGQLLIKLRPEYWVVFSSGTGGAAPLRYTHLEVGDYPRVPLSQIEKVFGSGRP